MSMERERSEAVQLLDYVIYILFVYEWLVDSNTWLLLIRFAAQVQMTTPTAPRNRSRFRPTHWTVYWTSLLCMVVHAWWDQGRTDREGLWVDFLGKDHHFSKLHLIFLDATIAMLQLLLVTLTYGMARSVTPGEEVTIDVPADEASGCTSSLTLPIAVFRVPALRRPVRTTTEPNADGLSANAGEASANSGEGLQLLTPMRHLQSQVRAWWRHLRPNAGQTA